MLALTATSLLGGGAFLSGCEDSEANARQQASATITEQSRKLEAAARQADAAKLQAVVSSLNSVKGSDGQQAAAAMLASSANRELAGISLKDAAGLERQAGDLQSLLLAQIDAAVELSLVLEALNAIDPAEQTRNLDQARSAANASLQQHSSEMADLDQPINELSAARRDGIQRAEQLRQRANDLLRQASQMNYSDGFSAYQEGVETRREADQVEYQVALTELQLNYRYEAQHNIANAQAKSAQALITSIDESKRDLATMRSDLRQEVQASGRTYDELVASITNGVQALQNMRSGELGSAYGEAVAKAEAAIAKAQSASAKVRQSDSAKIARARAAALKGRAYAQQLRGLEEQALVLQRLVNASDAIGTNFSDALQATRNQIEQATAMALEAYSMARESAQGITGRDTQEAIATFVTGLDRAIISLGGQPMAGPGADG